MICSHYHTLTILSSSLISQYTTPKCPNCHCACTCKINAIYQLLDINECVTNNGGCQQGCVNTGGGFYCTCPDGYRLNDEGFLCKGKLIMLLYRKTGQWLYFINALNRFLK